MLRLSPLILLSFACAPGAGGMGLQPSVQAHLVVHVDPMSRSSGSACVDPVLRACGPVSFEPFLRRTRNLSWLADSWIPAGRTVDLQLGPEMALAWAGHPDTLETLGEGAESVAEEGLCALHQLVDSGQASLGLHMHGVLPDGPHSWGELRQTITDDPCAATRENPIVEADPQTVETLVHYGASAVHPLATMLGAPIKSFTAHLPRSMATKIAVLEDPDSIDPDVHRSFPESFQPVSLGSAYAECLQQAVDHPPFEVYPADGLLPLGAGQGPMIVPGNRVVGSMAPHLGKPSDGSLEAARRRLLQLLLNWRVAGLRGERARPWVFTFHAHLFDLGKGAPDPTDPAGRLRAATQGHPFREDVDALARTIDQLSARPHWHGVGGSEGVMQWSLPEDLSVAGSRFGLDADGELPYLPLVTERLAEGHLVCSTSEDGFDFFVVDRCPSGWAWGGSGFGQHCSDGQVPEVVTVILKGGGGCASGDSHGLQVGEVDGERMTGPSRCPDGLRVPPSGLIVEREDGGAWRSDLCGRVAAVGFQP